MIQARRSTKILWAYLFADCQRALMKRRCRREVALVPKQASKIVEALGRIGMFGAEYLFADSQRLLQKRP